MSQTKQHRAMEQGIRGILKSVEVGDVSPEVAIAQVTEHMARSFYKEYPTDAGDVVKILSDWTNCLGGERDRQAASY